MAWQARLGRRGLVVAMMENLLYLASPDASQKCQLYAFSVPEKDLPAAQDRIPGLKVRGWAVGGGDVPVMVSPLLPLPLLLLCAHNVRPPGC